MINPVSGGSTVNQTHSHPGPAGGLDFEECLALAIRAIEDGQHYPALFHLKQALALREDHGPAWYLLAAEHAQLGMADRAREEFLRALELVPDMHVARLQLAMLNLATGRIDDANDALRPLLALEGDGNGVRSFATGLKAATEQDAETARQWLARGIEENQTNPSLNENMRNIIHALGNQAPDGETEADPASALYLSAYARAEH
jgi:tetratricopeptide (TPR) repeat protein